MKNNRGQVLVVFVLMLPILFMLSALIIDSGYLFIEKRKVDYTVKYAVEYGVENIDMNKNVLKDKINMIINKNIKDIKNLNIIIEDVSVRIQLSKSQNSIFSTIFSKDSYDIKSNYYGYSNGENLIIRKE